MRAYDLAIMFAILGAVTGFLQGSFIASDTSWFDGVGDSSLPDEHKIDVDEEQAESLNPQGDMSMSEVMVYNYHALGIFLNSMVRIFYFSDLINNVFYIPHPDDATKNIFSPVGYIINVGVILVYMGGAVQLWRQSGFKGMD